MSVSSKFTSLGIILFTLSLIVVTLSRFSLYLIVLVLGSSFL